MIVQARMNSARFPVKVLAPLAGKPLIAQVLQRICDAVASDDFVLVTSLEATDDPLVRRLVMS